MEHVVTHNEGTSLALAASKDEAPLQVTQTFVRDLLR